MHLFIPFYLILCFSLILLVHKKNNLKRNVAISVSIFFFIFYLLVIGLREFDIEGDTRVYLSMFHDIIANLPIEERIEPGFRLLLKFFSLIGLSDRQFLFSLSLLQTLLFFLAFQSYLRDSRSLLVGSLFFSSMFCFYSFGANVLRQGLAIPFIILFCNNLFCGGKVRFRLVYSILAISFHYTSVVPIFLAVFAQAFCIRVRFWILCFFCVSLLSFVGFVDLFIHSAVRIFIPLYDSYLHNAAEDVYRTGFRFDFWFVTIIPIFLYMNLTSEGKFIFRKKIIFYLLLACTFVSAFSIPYSDRIGAYAWTFSGLLISEFIGYYKFRFLNSYRLTAIGFAILGLLSFFFYQGKNFHYTLELLF